MLRHPRELGVGVSRTNNGTTASLQRQPGMLGRTRSQRLLLRREEEKRRSLNARKGANSMRGGARTLTGAHWSWYLVFSSDRDTPPAPFSMRTCVVAPSCRAKFCQSFLKRRELVHLSGRCQCCFASVVRSVPGLVSLHMPRFVVGFVSFSPCHHQQTFSWWRDTVHVIHTPCMYVLYLSR